MSELFIAELDADSEKALAIHQEISRLVTAFVKKKLTEMFGSYLEDDVTDIVSQTFLIVYTNFAKGKPLDFSNPPKSLISYFWRVADNLCKVYQRGKYKDKKYYSLSDENQEGNVKQFPSTLENPEDELSRKEQDNTYQHCQYKVLNELKTEKPEKYNLLISYTNDNGKTSQEMKKHREGLAESLGTTSNNLALIINRIRETLRNRLQKCLAAKSL